MRVTTINKLALIFIGFLVISEGLAQEVEVPSVVIDNRHSTQGHLNSFSVFKTEKVAKQKFSEPQRQTLTDLVQDQVGVDAQVYCANCGAKRLTINGLKGEHTSILVDGLPLHSAVSSFYGVDNIPVTGLADVEVMRGAGASLTNPEAIGGTLNLITVNPLDSENQYSTSVGVDDRLFGKSQNHSLMLTRTAESKRWGVSAGGQFARQETWDQDSNNIAESPQRQNYSAMAKGRFLLGKKNDFSIRLGRSELEILGGYWDPRRPDQVAPVAARESDFVNGSVEEDYIGAPNTITDWIDIERSEGTLTGTHYLTDELTYDWRIGYARQAQNAIYQHGFDYANIDNLLVADTHIDWAVGSDHVLSLGVFVRDQRLRSSSAVLFQDKGLRRDSFNFNSFATYAQYSYFLDETLQIDLALRADQVDVNWLDLDNRVSETVLAPRLQVLHNFNEHLSQRFSYGLGYRAPLTFFESQHGNEENGYQVDITEMEKAHSLVYSLSWNKPDYYITWGSHYTHLENMAYGFESFNSPIFYRNDTEDYDIFVTDLLVGVKPWHWWLLEASYEVFNYQKGYKRNLPTAAIERRVQLRSTIDKGAWTHIFNTSIIGSRDLSQYGNYPDHFVNFGTPGTAGVEQKNQKSPTFFTVDSSISYEFKKYLVFSFAVNNIFNYTQASVGDTPATWHWHFVHSHYDGLHTWGPNIGRQYFMTLSGEF